MKLTIKKVKQAAEKAGKKLVYNRSTGEYKIVYGFTASCGEIPFRDEKNKLGLDENQLKKLLSYV